MRYFKYFALLITLILLFCACTRQESIDIFAFCDRFNAFQEEDIIQTETLFRAADNAQEYNTEFAFCPGHTALLSVTVDETDTVTGFQLTVIPEESALDETARQALFNTYVELAAVYTAAENTDDALVGVQEAGLSAENLAFTDFGYAGEYDGRQYAVFSGEQYISLFCMAL